MIPRNAGNEGLYGARVCLWWSLLLLVFKPTGAAASKPSNASFKIGFARLDVDKCASCPMLFGVFNSAHAVLSVSPKLPGKPRRTFIDAALALDEVSQRLI